MVATTDVMLFSNNATAMLAFSVGTGDTSITLLSGKGALFPSPTAGQYFPVTLQNIVSGVSEVCYCTGRTGDVLTLERAREGTAAIALTTSNGVVQLRPTKGVMEKIIQRRFTGSDVGKVLKVEATGEVIPDGQAAILGLLDYGDIATYGATGDSGQDATQAFLDAFAETDEVFLRPRGTYAGIYMVGALGSAISAGQRLFIHGNNAMMKLIDNTNAPMIEHSTGLVAHFGFRDIVFDGNKDNQSAYIGGLIQGYFEEFDASNFTIQSAKGNHLWLRHIARRADITRFRFRNGAEHTGTLNQDTSYLVLHMDAARDVTGPRTVSISNFVMEGIVPSVFGRGVGGIVAAGATGIASYDSHILHIHHGTLKDCGQDAAGNVLAAVKLYRRSTQSTIDHLTILGGQDNGVEVQGSDDVTLDTITVRGLTGVGKAAIEWGPRDGDKTCNNMVTLNPNISNCPVGVRAVFSNTLHGRDFKLVGGQIENVDQFIRITLVEGKIHVVGTKCRTANDATPTTHTHAIAIGASSTDTDINVDILVDGVQVDGSSNLVLRVRDTIGPITVSNIQTKNITGTGALTFTNHTGDISIDGNTLEGTPNPVMSFATVVGRIALRGNTAPTAATVSLTGGSVIHIDQDNSWNNEPTVPEAAVSVVPKKYGSAPGLFRRYGSTGDGVADDTTPVNDAVDQAQGSLRHVEGTPGDSHKITSNIAPTGSMLMRLFGTKLKATTAIDIFTPKTRLDLAYGTFDTFLRAIHNGVTTDPTLDLRVIGTEFVNGANSPINIECPVRDFTVLGIRSIDSKGYQVRLGRNDFSLQQGWQSCLVAFGFYKNVSHISNDTAAIISYAPFSRIIGNATIDVNGFGGTDTTFYYTKSPYGIVALNVGDDITSTGSTVIGGIKLKGSARGTSATPNGYAATALGNTLRTAADDGTGIQVEADEQAVIANYLEGFRYGLQGGSGLVDKALVGLNRFIYSGASTVGRGVLFGSVEGEMYNVSMNLSKGFATSIYLNVPTAKTVDKVLIANNQLKGLSTANGEGVRVDSTDVDGVTRVLISDSQIDNHNQGVNLARVKWGSLSNLQFGALSTSTRPIFMTSCKNIVGRQVFSNEIQTTDATATIVFQMGDLADGNVLKVTMHALAKKSDMSAVGSLRRDFLYKRTGGVTTLVASGGLVNDGGNALPADALLSLVSSDRGTFRVKGIAAETWNWFVNFDFELL